MWSFSTGVLSNLALTGTLLQGDGLPVQCPGVGHLHLVLCSSEEIQGELTSQFFNLSKLQKELLCLQLKPKL